MFIGLRPSLGDHLLCGGQSNSEDLAHKMDWPLARHPPEHDAFDASRSALANRIEHPLGFLSTVDGTQPNIMDTRRPTVSVIGWGKCKRFIHKRW